MTQAYVIQSNSQGQLVVTQTADGTGIKTRACRLAEALGGRWVHRHHGYVMSPRKLVKFEQLYAEGWDAKFFDKTLIPPE